MAAETEDRKPIRVLYMEDNAGLARLFQKKLERLGYRVDIASNGGEGLEKAAKEDYDAIAVDQAMPVMNGLDVIRALSSGEKKTPIIMVTGAGDETTAVRAMKLGAEDYMVKDVECAYIDLFPAVVKGILDKKRMAEEKRRAEEALRESEEKYRTLMENANDCILAVQEGKIIFANSAFEKLIGRPPEGLDWRFLMRFVATADLGKVERKYKRTLEGLAPGPFEIEFSTAGGRKIVLEVKSNLIQYDGRPAAMAVMRDISERKKMEEELLRAKKLEAVGILAGGIAHDYNNILAVLLGNISLAQAFVDPGGKVHKLLCEAENASVKARDLTHKFIMLSKGGEPVKKEISPRKLLMDALDRFSKTFQARWDLNAPDDIRVIEADEAWLGQALDNMLVNAFEAMRQSGSIGISCRNVVLPDENPFALPGGGFVVISIEDRGGGIAEGHLGKIFDPYFSTKTRGARKGMGLGLSISHSIVRKHDGYIAVDSRAGKGTRFDIYLPAVRKADEKGGRT